MTTVTTNKLASFVLTCFHEHKATVAQSRSKYRLIEQLQLYCSSVSSGCCRHASSNSIRCHIRGWSAYDLSFSIVYCLERLEQRNAFNGCNLILLPAEKIKLSTMYDHCVIGTSIVLELQLVNVFVDGNQYLYTRLFQQNLRSNWQPYSEIPSFYLYRKYVFQCTILR